MSKIELIMSEELHEELDKYDEEYLFGCLVNNHLDGNIQESDN